MNRFSKLMQAMGRTPDPEVPEESQMGAMTPDRNEALTGMEHPELQKKRQMISIIDSKIAQIEESGDPMAMESLNFWKQKRDELSAE